MMMAYKMGGGVSHRILVCAWTKLQSTQSGNFASAQLRNMVWDTNEQNWLVLECVCLCVHQNQSAPERSIRSIGVVSGSPAERR